MMGKNDHMLHICRFWGMWTKKGREKGKYITFCYTLRLAICSLESSGNLKKYTNVQALSHINWIGISVVAWGRGMSLPTPSPTVILTCYRGWGEWKEKVNLKMQHTSGWIIRGSFTFKWAFSPTHVNHLFCKSLSSTLKQYQKEIVQQKNWVIFRRTQGNDGPNLWVCMFCSGKCKPAVMFCLSWDEITPQRI